MVKKLMATSDILPEFKEPQAYEPYISQFISTKEQYIKNSSRKEKDFPATDQS